LIGDFRQGFPGHPLPFTVGIEETQHALRLLERLDQTIEQQPVYRSPWLASFCLSG
jgi:hypothetical protein